MLFVRTRTSIELVVNCGRKPLQNCELLGTQELVKNDWSCRVDIKYSQKYPGKTHPQVSWLMQANIDDVGSNFFFLSIGLSKLKH